MPLNVRSCLAIMVALVLPTICVLPKATAQPVAESKGALKVFPLVQIVGLDAAARTVKVLTPKIMESVTHPGGPQAIDIASDKGEVLTLALSPKVVMMQVKNGSYGPVTSVANLDEVAAAFRNKQHITVGIAKDNNGKTEVQQLTILADQPQQTVVQLLKAHFDIRPIG